jgi:hypothetical protein
MSMKREIKNGQSGSLPGLRIHPQQELVRKLISGRCQRLPESNVQDISFRVIRDTNRLHCISPPAPTNLVSSQNKIVLRTVRIKAKAHYNDNGGVRMWEPMIIPRIQIHFWTDRVLKSSPPTNGLQDLHSPLLHLRVLLANMVPAFLSQINLMAQLVSHRSAYHMNPVCNILRKDATESGTPLMLWRCATHRLIPHIFTDVILSIRAPHDTCLWRR